jgi:hypothetical protein
MVCDKDGIGRFAGIATGAHFLKTFEVIRSIYPHVGNPIPDPCYSLFLASPTLQPSRTDTPGVDWGVSPIYEEATWSSSVQYFVRNCLSDYIEQLNIFIQNWEAFCPIVVPEELKEDVSRLFIESASHSLPTDTRYATLMTITMVYAINALYNFNQEHPIQISERVCYISMARQLKPSAISHGCIKSLQALSLLAFYGQITGQKTCLREHSGGLVRIAQSLGLHRHSRRFQMTVGENELRKRLWWWIYGFEKLVLSFALLTLQITTDHISCLRVSSISLGLPTLIDDANIDTEMPQDCVLENTSLKELRYPLPGDVTPVFYFNKYVGLMKILSTVLRLLYVTKERYGGVEKIARLEKDLQAWNHDFNSSVGFYMPEASGQNMIETANWRSSGDGKGAMVFWLKVVAHVVSLLLHRPGLTFDLGTPEFPIYLNTCAQAGREVIELLCMPEAPLAVRMVCPVGPNTIFHSAVMQIYQHLVSFQLEGNKLNGTPDFDTVAKAIKLLKDDIEREERRTSESDSETPGFYLTSLSESASALQNFVSSFQLITREHHVQEHGDLIYLRHGFSALEAGDMPFEGSSVSPSNVNSQERSDLDMVYWSADFC